MLFVLYIFVGILFYVGFVLAGYMEKVRLHEAEMISMSVFWPVVIVFFLYEYTFKGIQKMLNNFSLK